MDATHSDGARMTIEAGLEPEEQGDLFSIHDPALVRDGKVSRARLDEAVRRVLRLESRLGHFDRPFVDEETEHSVILSPPNLAEVREIAGRSLVLLKKEGNVLPIGDKVRSIAVIGPFADEPQTPLGP